MFNGVSHIHNSWISLDRFLIYKNHFANPLGKLNIGYFLTQHVAGSSRGATAKY